MLGNAEQAIPRRAMQCGQLIDAVTHFLSRQP